MVKRFDTLLFPGGKHKVFTLSYDDGVTQDRRLAALLRSYGAKATFNLNAGLLGRRGTARFDGRLLEIEQLAPEELAEVYAGHEIGGHSLTHANLSSVGTPLGCWEIVEDKRRLEALTGEPLRMFAYPFGGVNSDVEDALRLAGYQGARTVNSTHGFALPDDPLRWNPTCHHSDPQLMELAQRFVDTVERRPLLFFVWGHAYEFDGRGNWDCMERLLDFLAAQPEDIWFATNGELLAYLDAWRRLEYAVDGSLIRNPSALDVTVAPVPGTALTLKAGQTTSVPNANL